MARMFQKYDYISILRSVERKIRKADRLHIACKPPWMKAGIILNDEGFAASWFSSVSR